MNKVSFKGALFEQANTVDQESKVCQPLDCYCNNIQQLSQNLEFRTHCIINFDCYIFSQPQDSCKSMNMKIQADFFVYYIIFTISGF